MIALRVAPEIVVDPVPLSAIANHTVPRVRCQRCRCWMSAYHDTVEAWCWPCQSAEPGMMPTRVRLENGTATGIVLSALVAAGGSATAREIRVGTGLASATVKDCLRRLTHTGSVSRTPNGRAPVYALSAVAAAA